VEKADVREGQDLRGYDQVGGLEIVVVDTEG
jgi:hypothetical protein